MKQAKGITGTALKWIALLTMIVDHVAYTAEPVLNETAYLVMRGIGRLAFPLFTFCIVEGFLHTKSLPKYALRLGIFAVLSEVPFDMMVKQSWVYFGHNNVLWTFLILLAVLFGLDRIRKRFAGVPEILLSLLTVAAGAGLACVTNTDYSWCGVVLGSVFFLFRDKKWLMLGLAALTLACESIENWIELVALASLGLILCYDGRKSLIERELPRYFFYVMYPLHLLMLGLYGILLRSGI